MPHRKSKGGKGKDPRDFLVECGEKKCKARLKRCETNKDGLCPACAQKADQARQAAAQAREAAVAAAAAGADPAPAQAEVTQQLRKRYLSDSSPDGIVRALRGIHSALANGARPAARAYWAGGRPYWYPVAKMKRETATELTKELLKGFLGLGPAEMAKWVANGIDASTPALGIHELKSRSRRGGSAIPMQRGVTYPTKEQIAKHGEQNAIELLNIAHNVARGFVRRGARFDEQNSAAKLFDNFRGFQ